MNSESAQEPQSSSNDAINQLVSDHQKVKGLFDQFENIKEHASNQEKGALVDKICDELGTHEAVENDVFFPAVREVLGSKNVLEEAAVEQQDAGEAIHALGELKAGEPGFDNKVAKLGATIAAHAAEEEKDVFPKVRRSDIDTDTLGSQMSAHKAELKSGDDPGR